MRSASANNGRSSQNNRSSNSHRLRRTKNSQRRPVTTTAVADDADDIFRRTFALWCAPTTTTRTACRRKSFWATGRFVDVSDARTVAPWRCVALRCVAWRCAALRWRFVTTIDRCPPPQWRNRCAFCWSTPDCRTRRSSTRPATPRPTLIAPSGRRSKSRWDSIFLCARASERAGERAGGRASGAMLALRLTRRRDGAQNLPYLIHGDLKLVRRAPFSR